MSDASVNVLQNSSGDRLIDNESVPDHPDGVAYRQRVQLAGASLAAIANPTNSPPSETAYGLPVRNVWDRYHLTPFGQLRTAGSFTLGSFVQRYGFDTAFMTKAETAGGTVAGVPNHSSTILNVVAGGDRAQQATRERFVYRPGHATRWLMTCVLDTVATADLTRRWGQFDTNDGLFFKCVDGAVSVVTRSSTSGTPVETAIAQASWNVDPLDGTGPSGKTLDCAKLNIYEVVYEWLGAGLVWWFINGDLVHVDNNPATYLFPYMKTAILPLQWDVQSTGGAGTLELVCASIASEGESDAHSPALGFGAVTPAAHSVPTTPGEALISLRPAATYNSVTNRGHLLPVKAIIANDVGSRALVKVVLNPTSLTGASWASAASGSIAEVDTTATTFSGGVVLGAKVVDANNTEELDLTPFFSHIGRKLLIDSLTGVADVLSIIGFDLVSGTTDLFATLEWGEVR